MNIVIVLFVSFSTIYYMGGRGRLFACECIGLVLFSGKGVGYLSVVTGCDLFCLSH